ncbi:MAG: SDR family oxidoreductase [Clostridium sp.]|nr:SDR family oxidoreductase [Clostridium sp.]
MKQTFTLAGRVAVVTGAAQGIGYHSAKMLCDNGMKVALVDLNEEKVKASAAKAASEGGEAIGIGCDVSDENDIEAMIEKVAETFGTVDVVVNSAGILSSTKIPDIKREDWDKMLAVNLSGTFFTIQKAWPYLIKSSCGRVINISSTAGRMGGVENSMSYTASKGGVCAITKGIARKMAPYGVTVNAVCPGPTATDIVKTYTEEELKNLNSKNMLGRLGKPEEIAAAVCFLASEEAGYITASMIDVNGGFYIGS